MHVNPSGNNPGSHLLVRSTGGPPAVGPRAEPDPERAPDSTRESSRQAWFDVNGDGRIEDRSALYGGDGILIVPEAVRREHASRARVVERGAGPDRDQPATPVHVEHARDAYVRYGEQPTDDRDAGEQESVA